MTQEDKIRAYLTHQLNTDEAAAFRAETLADPELAARVKGMKLTIMANEMAFRRDFKEKMLDRKPPRNPPLLGNKLVLLGAILTVFAVFLWKFWPTPPNNAPVSSSQNIESAPSTPAVEESPQTPTETAPQPPVAAEKTADLAKFGAAIVGIEVVKFDRPVAMRSAPAGKKIEEAIQKARAERLFTGFFLKMDGKDYVIASTEAVALAADGSGDIVARDAALAKYPLRLVGKDEMFGIAVLERTDNRPLPAPLLTFSPSDAIRPGQSLAMFASPLDKTRPAGQVGWGKLTTQQNGCFSAKSSTDWPADEGPVLDENGRVLGMVTHFASAAFVGERDPARSRYFLSAGLCAEVIRGLIKKGQIARAYFGLGLEALAENGGVKIFKVLPGSPASPYEDNLKGKMLDSINSQRVKNLVETAQIMGRLKPKEVVSLACSTFSGEKTTQQIFTKDLNEAALEVIAEAAVNDIPGFSALGGPGSPRVEYTGGGFERGVYVVTGLCPDRSPCQPNIYSKADLGEMIRTMALQNRASLQLYRERPEKEVSHPFTFMTQRLYQ